MAVALLILTGAVATHYIRTVIRKSQESDSLLQLQQQRAAQSPADAASGELQRPSTNVAGSPSVDHIPNELLRLVNQRLSHHGLISRSWKTSGQSLRNMPNGFALDLGFSGTLDGLFQWLLYVEALPVHCRLGVLSIRHAADAESGELLFDVQLTALISKELPHGLLRVDAE